MFYRFDQDVTILAMDINGIMIAGLSQGSAEVQRSAKFMLQYQRHGESALATRYWYRQGLQEPHHFFFPSHLCTKNGGMTWHGRCQPTIYTHLPQPQPKQVPITCQRLGNRGDEGHTILGSSQLPHVCRCRNATRHCICR